MSHWHQSASLARSFALRCREATSQLRHRAAAAAAPLPLPLRDRYHGRVPLRPLPATSRYATAALSPPVIAAPQQHCHHCSRPLRRAAAPRSLPSPACSAAAVAAPPPQQQQKPPRYRCVVSPTSPLIATSHVPLPPRRSNRAQAALRLPRPALLHCSCSAAAVCWKKWVVMIRFKPASFWRFMIIGRIAFPCGGGDSSMSVPFQLSMVGYRLTVLCHF